MEKIADKIYIGKDNADTLSKQNNVLAGVWNSPVGLEGIEPIEYIRLPSVWHDARKKKHPEGVCGNNPVVVVGLRNGRISYRYLWEDMEDCWLDLEVLAECKTYEKALWAYLRDLVPGVKKIGF